MRKWKISAAIVSLLLTFNSAHTQSNTFKLPEILPPSPDVAALSKGAELSSTPHTGAPNASIPVYQIKLGSYSLPISINYSSNGYKPEEIPSRVGLGWSFNAGGSVSRIVRGKPDDFCTAPTTYLTEAQILNYTSTAYYFITDLEDQSSYHDGQPDEYRYNVNGLSGKFIIKRDGNILQLPYNNVKITVEKSQGAVTDIHITDGNGVKYHFGDGLIEKTLQHNLVNNMLQKQEITTAWMLSRISIPDGNYIDFGYGSVNHYVQSGVMESVRKGVIGDYCNPPTGPPIQCPVDADYSSKSSLIRYSSKYLTTINTNTGTAIAVSYADRPDGGGDNRVDIILVSNGYGTSVKKLQFEYVDKSGSSTYNYGFFLKKVYVKDPTNNSSEQQVYELSYVDETNAGAGATFTYGLDHLGFANGATNSTLLPVVNTYVYNGNPLFQNIGTANREPNSTYSKKGMLEKITYPTEGYDEFYYEPNMKTWWDSVDVLNIKSARAWGVGAPNPYSHYTQYFTPGRDRTGEIYLNVTWNSTGTEPAGNPAPKTAFAYLYVNSTNTLVANISAEGYNGGLGYQIEGGFLSQGYTLQAGVEYRLDLEVRYGSNVSAQVDVVYDAGNTKEWKELNEELCGVRVRKIVSYDPVSRKSTSKFYRYRSLTDTVIASANKLYNPVYVTPYQNGLFCTVEEVVCNGFVLSSNSATTLYSNEAAGVTYKWVIESDDSTFANGGIEHSFENEGMFNGMPIVGGNIPDIPADPYNYMNGVDTQIVYFNKDRVTVKKTNNYYSIDTRINEAQYENYMVRKRYEKVLVGPSWDDYDFLHLDVTSYPIYTRWDHLDSTVTLEYDLANNKALKTKQWFTYGNPNNVLPTIKYTYASDQSVLKDEMKYPTDLAGTVTVCSTMVAKNMKDPVMETKSYKDTKLLFQTNTDYKDWFNNATILAPELVKNKKGTSSQETRIRYYQYDTDGNPLELSKENDMHIVYIWDYNGTLPIAEVTNASWGQGVAYTSFEADAKGGWTFTGTPVTEGTEPAGKKSYALSNGNITYTGTMTSGKKYYVSYWAKNGTVNVNGSTSTSMLQKNNWTLYRKLITYSGSGGITVSGSGYIDELRLYPDTAFMKTFTYTPDVGITTSADNNSLYEQYEYDAFTRLLRIRDMDRNILKQYEYKYGSTVTGCSTTPDWQVTGNYRCAKNNVVNNNNTGIKEREELDHNNCSETYGQTRWVSIGSSGECPVTSNCSGSNKRVINGVCYTGCKQLISSVYLGNLQWKCTFRYVWTEDGFIGPEFEETSSYHCQGAICDLD